MKEVNVMIEPGKMQKLEVASKIQIGLILKQKSDKTGDGVLLPKNQVSQGMEIGLYSE